ncbi:hypothetical protein M408DRAFT_230818 [Serendipita vermifera MAFF 305830]|uniref:Uncharacterized protein n=1 Tax=Serendipita vermifera MAFF 305830 TaxID=933852 RepID=A0A0C3AZP2_SERVB|nr:hypothetical protein M408DRAFT_230818 [Serendipita vermifera MAFF 305830]
MATQPNSSLGVPIKMPTDRRIIQKPVSATNLRQNVASPIPSPRPAMRPMNRGNHAQVVLLKRKRNEEPLDGLLLEMNSRNMSDLDLARQTAENSADDEAGEDEDVTVKDSIRARKRKKVASSRGFFQLAETVEKAKWDDEAWRRDFNKAKRLLPQLLG